MSGTLENALKSNETKGRQRHCACADPENSVMRMGVLKTFLFINVFHRGPCGPPPRSNWTLGSNCFSRGSVPVIIRKQTATCDFPGVGADLLYPSLVEQRNVGNEDSFRMPQAKKHYQVKTKQK